MLRPEASARPALAQATLLALIALVASAAGYLLLPVGVEGRAVLGHVALTLLPLTAGVACLMAVLASSGLTRVSWSLFGLAALSAAAGQLLWLLADLGGASAIPIPEAPFALFLAFHPLFAVGALLLLRHVRLPGEGAEAALDAGLVLTASLVLVLRFVAEPVSAVARLDEAQYQSIVLMQGASIASLSVAGLLLVWRQTALPAAAVAGLVLASAIFAVANFMAAAGADPNPRPGDPVELLWLAGWTAMLVGALAGAAPRDGGVVERAGGWALRMLRQAVAPGTVLALGIVAIDAVFAPAISFPTAVTMGILCGLLAVRIALALHHAERRTGAAAELEQTRALIEVSHALAASTELTETLPLVSEWTARLLRARGAGIELLSEDGATLRIAAVAGDYQAHVGMEFPVAGSFTGWVVLHGRVRASAHAASDPAIHPDSVDLLGGNALAAAPLKVRGRTLGTLFVHGGHPFTDEQLDLLQGVADQAALAIHSALLFEEVRTLSMTDPLTGLANRRQLDRDMAREFAAAERGRRLSAVLFDLDSFKRYNDHHGHLAGDAVLRMVGEVLRTETRAMNLAARFGGDEFVVLLSDTDGAGAELFVRRVERRFTAEAERLGAPTLRLSAGVAEYDPSMREPEDILRHADRALYRTKEVRFA
ncbi:MAG TPA: sensor domain-containing diguanylate cyclase [Longimicrobiales bacterium]|nr:sensor domain-containing diguanylate cyclase [Longimicrobiales bacterium]